MHVSGGKTVYLLCCRPWCACCLLNSSPGVGQFNPVESSVITLCWPITHVSVTGCRYTLPSMCSLLCHDWWRCVTFGFTLLPFGKSVRRLPSSNIDIVFTRVGMVGMQSAIGEGMTRRDHSEVSNQVFTSGLLHEFCRGWWSVLTKNFLNVLCTDILLVNWTDRKLKWDSMHLKVEIGRVFLLEIPIKWQACEKTFWTGITAFGLWIGNSYMQIML